MKRTELKDKLYKLKKGTPLSYTLPSRNHPRFPLLWFDEDKRENRPLRYSINQNSPFEDEQDGNAILEPIVFNDGFLRVSRTNPVLQEFLYYHPLNGKVFVEVDEIADAAKEVEKLDLQVDAMILAKEMSLEEMEIITRVLFGKDPSTMKTEIIRRDILVFAKTNPSDFINAVKDPELQFQGKVRLFFDKKLLGDRNSGKEIWFNTPTNKKKMLSVPYGLTPFEAAVSFLKTDEGLDALKMLETFID